MPYASGTYTPPSSPGAFNPAISGQPATASAWNTLLTDMSLAMSTAILKDGTQTVTADIPLNSHKLTLLANATLPTDAVNAGQITATAINAADDTGTENAYVIAPAVPISAYAAYQCFWFKAANLNTGASTLAVSGLAAKAIKQADGTTDLQRADILPGALIPVMYDGTNFQLLSVLGLRGVANTWRASQAFSATSTFTAAINITGAQFNEAQATNLASASTTNIAGMGGNYVHVTGTTTITALGTTQAGARRIVEFEGILTLTHNATSLILPTGANIVTAAGDVAVFVSEGSGNWRCASYQRASGAPLTLATGALVNRAYSANTSFTTLTTNIPADDTIPQVTEGDQILSVAITPQTTTNRIRARVVVPLGAPSGVSGIGCVALFRNGGANAISAEYVRVTDGVGTYSAVLEFEDSPGSTSAQTYTVRAGGSSYNLQINGDISGRLGGGSSRATIVLEEIVA